MFSRSPNSWTSGFAAIIVGLSVLLITPHPAQAPLPPVLASVKEVALTFDDGPSPAYTPQILALLRRYHAVATFFVLGSEAHRFPELVRTITEDGSVVANHGWQHLNLYRTGPAALWADAAKTQDFLRHLGVSPAPYYRPPYGNITPALTHLLRQHGYTVVLWSVDTRDWSLPGSSAITRRILTQVKPGAIILMHDGGGNRSQTVSALEAVLPVLSDEGYRFVTVPELAKHYPPAASRPGVMT